MSYIRRMKIAASLENLNEGGETEMVPAAAAEVEAGASEIAANVDEVEGLNASTEEAEGDLEALGDIQTVMQNSVDSGEGLSPDAAQIAEIAVESIMARLGFDRTESVMPSMESFGEKGSRLSATKMALESVSDKIKTGVAGVIRFIKMVWEKIKGFWASITKSRAAMEKHIEGLINRANALDNAAKKTSEELTGGFVKAVSIDGKASLATAQQILEESDALPALANEVSSLTHKAVQAVGEGSAKVKFADKVQATFKGKLKPASAKAEGESKAAYYGNFAGNRSIGIEPDTESSHGGFTIKIENHGKAAEKAPALSKAEAVQLLNSAKATLKALATFDKVSKNLQDVANQAMKVVEAMDKGNTASQEEGEAGREAAKNGNEKVAAMRKIVDSTSKVALGFPSLMFSAVKGSADYASASIGNMKAEEKKAA